MTQEKLNELIESAFDPALPSNFQIPNRVVAELMREAFEIGRQAGVNQCISRLKTGTQMAEEASDG